MIRNLFNKKILCVGLFILCLTNTNAQTENDTVANKNSVDTIIPEKSKGASCGVTVETVYVKTKFVTDLTKAMLGEFAGVRVITENGQPGIASDVRIRGINSINGSNAPLYVVDGIAYYGDIAAINVEDIASLIVLKDINSWLFYGTQASNGVIHITTKKGTAGKIPKINVDLRFGFNFAPQRHETITDPKTYTELGWQGFYTYRFNGNNHTAAANFASNNLFSNNDYGVNPYYNPFDRAGNLLINPETGKMYDDVGYRYKPEKWSDYLLRTGKKVETNASISGGSEKITYYTSFGYIKDEGYYLKSDFQRINTLANLDFNPLKWLDINLKVAYNNSVMNDPCQKDNMNNGFSFINGMPPIFPVFVPNTEEYDFGDVYNRNFGCGINPLAALETDKRKTETNNLILNNSIKIKLPFKLSIISDIGYNYSNANLNEIWKPFYGEIITGKELTNNVYHHLTARQMLRYDNVFRDKHYVDIFVGHEIVNEKDSFSYTSEYMGMVGSQERYSYKQTKGRIFAGARYNYDEKYFFEANTSFDKNPKFAKENRWFGSWAVGGAWLVSRENFMKNSKEWLSYLKMRVSYGVTGNDNFSGLYALGVDIKHEKNNIFNAGIEMKIKKVFNIEIDFYDRTTSDLFSLRFIPPWLGYGYYIGNGGSMKNRGVDLFLSANLVNRRDIRLNVRANANYNFSKMLSLPTEYRFGEEREMIMSGSLAKGHALDEWYFRSYAGVNELGEAMWIQYYDNNEDPYGMIDTYVIDVYTYTHQEKEDGSLMYPNADIKTKITNNISKAGYNFTGKRRTPDVFGGFGFDFDCYGVNLSATFAYQIGGYGYDNIYAQMMGDDAFGQTSWHKDMLGAWRHPDYPGGGNTDTDVPRLTGGLGQYAPYANYVSDRFLTSNNALQLANVTLGYYFPRKLIKPINQLSISVSCNNLLLASKRKGYNPFTFYSGNGRDQYQQGTTLQMGLNVIF